MAAASSNLNPTTNFTQLPLNGEDCCVCSNPVNTIDSWGHGLHRFHWVCISRWLERNPKCPICSIEVLNAHEFIPKLPQVPLCEYAYKKDFSMLDQRLTNGQYNQEDLVNAIAAAIISPHVKDNEADRLVSGLLIKLENGSGLGPELINAAKCRLPAIVAMVRNKMMETGTIPQNILTLAINGARINHRENNVSLLQC